MIEYALVGPKDVIREYSSRIDPGVETKEGWRWLPVERTSDQKNGEVSNSPVTTVLADKVTVEQTARPKSAPEIDAEKDSQLDGFDALALKLLFSHENRVRALEGEAAVTALQFRAAMKAML